MELNIFVYGTLRKNQGNYSLIKGDIKQRKKAKYKGHLYDLPFGYPAVVEGNGDIVGELLTFDYSEEILKRLDQLEDYYGPGKANLYERIEGTVTLESKQTKTCQLYVFPSSRKDWLQKKALLISQGDWVKWKEGQDDIYYFAYGSCMNRKDFMRTVESFEVLGRACLPNHRIAFTRYSSARKGGVADIIPEPNHVTEGILYRFSARFLDGLDVREGVNQGAYKRKTVEVKWNGERIPVLTYEVVNKLKKEAAPGQEYRDLILEGSDLLGPIYRAWLMSYIRQIKG